MARRSVRQTLRGECSRLLRIQDELDLAANNIQNVDLLAASHLDWTRIHLRSAIRELEKLIRIAAHERPKGGK